MHIEPVDQNTLAYYVRFIGLILVSHKWFYTRLTTGNIRSKAKVKRK